MVKVFVLHHNWKFPCCDLLVEGFSQVLREELDGPPAGISKA
jgi:hypothetical protein